MKTLLMTTAATLMLPALAQAAPVFATSYAMLNGEGQTEGGAYNYRDESYSGTGNVNVSRDALSGGLGELTDGVIPTENWNITEQPAGPGPYVGWLTINPSITFNFAQQYDFTSITFHFDDSNNFGGVRPPKSVDVNGIFQTVMDPATSAPFAVTVDLTSLAATDVLTANIERDGWVFLSEVTFDAAISEVPVPAAGLLLLGGLAGLGAWGRRRHS